MLRNRIAWGSAALTGLLVLMAISAVGAQRSEAWKQNYDQAVAESKTTGRPLLVHFYAKWCVPCRQMERDVLHSSDVLDALSKDFVAVLIDCGQHPELQMQFNIQSLPTDIVLGPDGAVLFRSEGSRDKKTYLTQLVRIVEPQTQPVENSPPVQKQPSADKVKLLVGLDRYSPVSLAKNRQWRKGKNEFALVWQEVVYLMFDEAEYREFKADPVKFAPRLLGCDPVVLWTSDRAVPGSTQFGAYFDGELYLFNSAANRDRFKGSPNLYSRPQHVLKVNEIDGPRWR